MNKITKEALLVALLLASIILIYPFLKYILFSLIIYLIIDPFTQKLQKIIKSNKLSAIVSILLLLVVFLVVISGIVYALFRDVSRLPDMLSPIFHELYPYISTISLTSIINKTYSFLIGFIESISQEMLGIIISFLLAYSIEIEKSNIVKSLKKAFDEEIDLDSILLRAKRIAYAVLYSNLLLWIIQAILSYIGFVLFNIPLPAILSILVFLFAILPILGPWTVWLIAAAILYIKGQVILATIAIIYGVILVTTVTELTIKPWLVSKFSQVNSAIVLIGILGGLKLFGFVGVFIGPVILALFVESFIEFTEKDKPVSVH